MSVARVRRSCLLLGALALGLAPAGHVAGEDGVIEINQAKVLAAGGFPFVISAPGSYRLTGNLDLTVLDPNTPAISVVADDVTLDLGGFQIIGPCPPPECSPVGRGYGVVSGNGVVVRNGTIRNMQMQAVYVGPGSRIERIRAIDNLYGGIWTGSEAAVIGNTVTGNTYHGIVTGGRSLVVGNQSNENSGDGIQVGWRNDAGVPTALSGNIVRDNSANGNSEDGIGVRSRGCVVIGNTTNSNGAGIWTVAGCLVIGNTAESNQQGIEGGAGSNVSGNTVPGNRDRGITTGDDGRIADNAVRDNTNTGIYANGRAGCFVIGNTVSGSTTGLDLHTDTVYVDNVVSSSTNTVVNGVPIGSNGCNGGTSCP